MQVVKPYRRADDVPPHHRDNAPRIISIRGLVSQFHDVAGIPARGTPFQAE
jgi:hypothetical protein